MQGICNIPIISGHQTARGARARSGPGAVRRSGASGGGQVIDLDEDTLPGVSERPAGRRDALAAVAYIVLSVIVTYVVVGVFMASVAR